MEHLHYLQHHESLHVFRLPHPLFRVDATVSPYAGCSNRCVYCPFGSQKVGVKTSLLHDLEKKIVQDGFRGHIGLGATCEPYCDPEMDLKLTRNAVELITKHRLPLQIFTKSELITRDIDLLKESSADGMLAVNISIFTLDRELQALFEPGVPSTAQRLDLLKTLRKEGIFAGVALAPILPYISDGEEDLDELFAAVRKAGGAYILPSVLYQDAAAQRESVAAAVGKKFPKILHRIKNIYEKEHLPVITYAARINDLLKGLSRKHNIPLYLPAQDAPEEGAGIRQELLK